MLTIEISSNEFFDEIKEEFVTTKAWTLHLEHSLISVSKWESRHNKPFFSTTKEKTHAETLYYIKCMTLDKSVDDSVYDSLTMADLKKIEEYIAAPMTATTFSDNSNKPNREIITSELIYYWMVAQNIPFECEKWHLNRLITLLRVCNVKNSPKKKRSRREIMAENAALNAARRKKYNTKG